MSTSPSSTPPTAGRTAAGWELQCTTGSSDKFYVVVVVDSKVVIAYGRNGNPGTAMVCREPGPSHAIDKALHRTEEKSGRGYLLTVGLTQFVVLNSTYDDLAGERCPAAADVVTAFRHAATAAGRQLPSPTPPDVGLLRADLSGLSTPAGSAAPARPRGSRRRLPPVGPCTRPNGQTYLPRTLGGQEDVALLRAARSRQEHILLAGPPGTGKTALVEAAFPDAEQIVGTADTAEADLVGTWIQDPDTGRFLWAPGPLQRAVERNVPLFVDEVALIEPRVLSVLYAPMDGRGELRITANPTLEPIPIGEGFFVAGACNLDVPGAQLSDALRDRFVHHVEVTTDFELARELGVPDDIVTVAANLDGRRRRGEVSWSPQLRSLLAFADQADRYGVEFAVAALISKAPAGDRASIIDALKLRFRSLAPLALGRRYDS